MSKFQKDNYLLVRNLITKKEAKTLAINLKKNEKNGLLDDPQVPQSVSFYNEKINTAKYFFDKIFPRVDSHYQSAITGSESIMKAKFH